MPFLLHVWKLKRYDRESASDSHPNMLNENFHSWFEPLPQQCPPEDAQIPRGVYYRLANSATAVCEDFWSQRKLSPNAKFNASECIAMAVSVYNHPGSLAALKKMKRHETKTVVAVKLVGDEAGRIKKTGHDVHHHSWWRPASFPVLEHICEVLP